MFLFMQYFQKRESSMPLIYTLSGNSNKLIIDSSNKTENRNSENLIVCISA